MFFGRLGWTQATMVIPEARIFRMLYEYSPATWGTVIQGQKETNGFQPLDLSDQL